MCESYEIDPDGDLLIILVCTNEEFAPWNDSDDPKALSELLETDSGVEIVSSTSTTNEESVLDGSVSPSPLHVKVSSKHLMLASRRFRKMLTGDWQEAKTIHQDGCRHVTLEGFDRSALKLLLDIIHGKTRKVPRSLDLEMLAKVAVLVDDFECHEEVEVFSDIWLKNLPNSPPTVYNRDLVLWIFISSVFRKSAPFKSATRTAVLHSTGPIRTLGLPLRSIIVDKIDQQRQELFGQLIDTLHGLLNKLRGDKPVCSFECDSMLLGALIKQMHPQDLIWPKPSKPFIGFSFTKIAEGVCDFQSPVWCAFNDLRGAEDEQLDLMLTKQKKGKGGVPRSLWDAEEVRANPQHKCSLQGLLNPGIGRLKDGSDGLDLQSVTGL